MAKEQLNRLLVDLKIYDSLDEANRRIIAREVKVDDEYITLPNSMVKKDVAITIKEDEEFVSRGGIKLKGALKSFDVKVSATNCLDIGSSTGGFSDCLLKCGAKRVVCVDVNYGQLAWQIRNDERVEVFERTNIKKVDPKQIGSPFDIIVIDVSFISLSSLMSKIATFCYPRQSKKSTHLIALVKPEFEAKQSENCYGCVLDEKVRLRTVEEVKIACVENGFKLVSTVESSIKGKKKGNTEYFIYALH